MAMRSRRTRGGPRTDDREDMDEGKPLFPRVIYTRDWLDPRLWARPGHAEDASSRTPSRGAMRFIYAVFIIVIGLCALAIILRALGK